jgi:hypothetical protein
MANVTYKIPAQITGGSSATYLRSGAALNKSGILKVRIYDPSVPYLYTEAVYTYDGFSGGGNLVFWLFENGSPVQNPPVAGIFTSFTAEYTNLGYTGWANNNSNAVFEITADESVFSTNALDVIQINSNDISFSSLTPEGPIPEYSWYYDGEQEYTDSGSLFYSAVQYDRYGFIANNEIEFSVWDKNAPEDGVNTYNYSIKNAGLSDPSLRATIDLRLRPDGTISDLRKRYTTPETVTKIIHSEINRTFVGFSGTMAYRIKKDINYFVEFSGQEFFYGVTTSGLAGYNLTQSSSFLVLEEEEIDWQARITKDVDDTISKINTILRWNITQEQVNSAVVARNGNTVNAIINGNSIDVVGSNPDNAPGFTFARSVIIPEFKAIPATPDYAEIINPAANAMTSYPVEIGGDSVNTPFVSWQAILVTQPQIIRVAQVTSGRVDSYVGLFIGQGSELVKRKTDGTWDQNTFNIGADDDSNGSAGGLITYDTASRPDIAFPYMVYIGNGPYSQASAWARVTPMPYTNNLTSGGSATIPIDIQVTVTKDDTEIDWEKRIQDDVNATYNAINSILKWNITQEEVNSVIIRNNGNTVTATITDKNIRIVGSNEAEKPGYTFTRDITIPEIPASVWEERVRNDVIATKDAINAIITWDITDEAIESVIVENYNNTVIVTREERILVITGTNPAVPEYSYVERLLLPDQPLPDYNGRIDADVAASKEAVIEFAKTHSSETTEAQLQALMVENYGNDVLVTLDGKTVIIVGTNQDVTEYVKTERFDIVWGVKTPDEIRASVDADVEASYISVRTVLRWDITQAQVDRRLVITDDNVIVATFVEDMIVIVGSNPALAGYRKQKSLTLPEQPIDPAAPKQWVRFKGLDGTLFGSYDASADSNKVDINGYNDYSVTIPAYALPNDVRVNWTKPLNNWSNGLILEDKAKPWNSEDAIHAAGFIVKRSMQGKTELNTFTLYDVTEYLKELRVPATWGTVRTAEEKVYSGETWGEVYAEIIRDGLVTLPGDERVAMLKNIELPAKTGSKYSYKIKNTDIPSVFEALCDLRDNVFETKGVEWKFIPKFTNSTRTAIKWVLVTGTLEQPHINGGKKLVVNTGNKPNADPLMGVVDDYSIEEDASNIYSKIIINGSNDETKPFIKQKTITGLGDSMPTLTKIFNAGVDLSEAEMEEQLNARTKYSLITDKDITLSIVDDYTGFWRKNVGAMVEIIPGEKTAGMATTARVVEVSWSNNNPGEVELKCVRPAARYPKLPSQRMNDVKDEQENTNAGFDNGGGLNGPGGSPNTGYGDGGNGEIPSGNIPGVDGRGEDFMPGGEIFEPGELPEGLEGYMGGFTTDCLAQNVQVPNNRGAATIFGNKLASYMYKNFFYYHEWKNAAFNYANTIDADQQMVINKHEIIIDDALGQTIPAKSEGKVTFSEIKTYTISGTEIIAAIQEYDPFPETVVIPGTSNEPPYGEEVSFEDITYNAKAKTMFAINNHMYVLITASVGLAGGVNRQAMFAAEIEADGGLKEFISMPPLSTYIPDIKPTERWTFQNTAYNKTETPDFYLTKDNTGIIFNPEEITDYKDSTFVNSKDNSLTAPFSALEINAEAPLAWIVTKRNWSPTPPKAVFRVIKDAIDWDGDPDTPPKKVGDYATREFLYTQNIKNVSMNEKGDVAVYAVNAFNLLPWWNEDDEGPLEEYVEKNFNKVRVGSWGKFDAWKKSENGTAWEVERDNVQESRHYNMVTLSNGNTVFDIRNPHRFTNFESRQKISYSAKLINSDGRATTVIQSRGEFFPEIDNSDTAYSHCYEKNGVKYYLLMRTINTNPTYNAISIYREIPLLKEVKSLPTNGGLFVVDNQIFENSISENSTTEKSGDANLKYVSALNKKSWKTADKTLNGSVGVGIDDDDKVWTWGDNAHFGTGQPEDEKVTQPPKELSLRSWIPGVSDDVPKPSGPLKVIALEHAALCLYQSGHLMAWGENVNHRFGITDGKDFEKPLDITEPNNEFIDFHAGTNHTIVINKKDRNLWYKGLIVTGSDDVVQEYWKVINTGAVKWKAIFSNGNDVIVGISTMGELYSMGNNASGVTAAGTLEGFTPTMTKISDRKDWKDVGVGATILWAITEDGRMHYSGKRKRDEDTKSKLGSISYNDNDEAKGERLVWTGISRSGTGSDVFYFRTKSNDLWSFDKTGLGIAQFGDSTVGDIDKNYILDLTKVFYDTDKISFNDEGTIVPDGYGAGSKVGSGAADILNGIIKDGGRGGSVGGR